MKFQYFTFFLNQTSPTLFEGIEKQKNKIEILREILCDKEKAITFQHRNVSLGYVFQTKIGNNYILGKVGRKSLLKRALSPQQGFSVQKEENWPNCSILFNLDTNPETGQRIAFELNSAVFTSPHEQIKALADYINISLSVYGYAIAINPITKQEKFWDIIKKNEGKIEKLTLSFNAPNLFKLTNTLSQDLKELQGEFNMTKTTFELENAQGKLNINENAPLFKEGVDYITRGGGEYDIKIKGRGRKTISSKNNIQTKSFEFEDLEITCNNPNILMDMIGRIFE